MRLLRVAAAAVNTTPLDWEGNGNRIRRALDEARQTGVQVLCLPELCISGYGCEDAFFGHGVAEQSWRSLLQLLPATRGLAVSLGLPIRHRGTLYNTSAMAVDGGLVGLVAKQHLPSEGVHYETRWFAPWPAGVRTRYETAGGSFPMGDLFFDVGGIRVGFEICEDAWVAPRPGARLAAHSMDVILNPSASHFAFGKIEIRKRLALEGSRAFGVTYVHSNLLGNEAGRIIYDGGAVIASGGVLVALGPRFGFDDVALTSATVDIDATRARRARSSDPAVASSADDVEGIAVPFELAQPDSAPSPPARLAWEHSEHLKEEEFTRAVALGLFDYLRKSRSRGFVVSLSGGADSATVATLVRVMLELAVDELGHEGVIGRLAGLLPESPPPATVESMTRALLLCVYQATANSSETTRSAARRVAEALGAEFMLFDVEPLVRGYRQLVESGIGRTLSWETDDLALQNIQARVRAPGVWMLANLRGALLLSTSNRSEAAVGYATMDGDTCGGLSPIAGIDKAFVLRWLRWMEETGPDSLAPWPALAAITAQAPTAELRPADAHQTDEDDLMPYDVLDAVERAAIRDKLPPTECLTHIRRQFPEHDPKTIELWVARFFRLWCRNQWKRERYAPSFHLDDENLDPKTWCRFPILSGGFSQELATLGDAAAPPTDDDGDST